MELAIPAHFAGPIPHAHDAFDEAIYVLSGRLLVAGDDEPQEAAPGSMFVAPRGHRHGFSNPSADSALVLGIWAPPQPALALMRDIGAALRPDAPYAACAVIHTTTVGDRAQQIGRICVPVRPVSSRHASSHRARPDGRRGLYFQRLCRTFGGDSA
jgi:hypothetical protein